MWDFASITPGAAVHYFISLYFDLFQLHQHQISVPCGHCQDVEPMQAHLPVTEQHDALYAFDVEHIRWLIRGTPHAQGGWHPWQQQPSAGRAVYLLRMQTSIQLSFPARSRSHGGNGSQARSPSESGLETPLLPGCYQQLLHPCWLPASMAT